MPQSEQTWPCTRCGKSHRQLEGCFLGPSGAQDAPTKNCEHERVDEDGYCRKCGSDTRGGFCLAQDAPQPQSEEEIRSAFEDVSRPVWSNVAAAGFRRDKDGGYESDALESEWRVWQLAWRMARAKSQPQSDERRAALESLLPGRAVNAAQTDWGKGYIEGWMARAKSQPQSAVIAEICSAFIELVDEYHADTNESECRMCQLRIIAESQAKEGE